MRANLGYGLTNTLTKKLAVEMAFELGKRPKNVPFATSGFMPSELKRWNDRISTFEQSKLESVRAKSTTQEIIESYFRNLKSVMEDNDQTHKLQ